MIRLRDLVPFFFIIRTFLIKVSIIVCGLVSIVWVSGAIYGSFYYAYLPHQTYTLPVHLTFQPCPIEDVNDRCSFLHSSVDLQAEKLFLDQEQKYSIRLEMTLPTDQINRNHGMFMVCIKLLKTNGDVTKSCKSSILPHRTSVSRALRSLIPFQNYGGEETLFIEFFSQLQSDASTPYVEGQVEVQSRTIGISSSSLHIHSQFTGLSYFMYHAPILAGIAGITFISIILISLLFLLIGASVDPVQVSAYHREDKDHLAQLHKSPQFDKLVNRVNKEKQYDPDQRQTNLHED